MHTKEWYDEAIRLATILGFWDDVAYFTAQRDELTQQEQGQDD